MTQAGKWLFPLASVVGSTEPSDNGGDDDWIIRDVVPRSEPWLLAGPPKCGKTWLALSLAAHVALGLRNWCGFPLTLGREGRVLVVALEDGRRRLGKRVWEVLRGLGSSPNSDSVRDHLRICDIPLTLPPDENAFVAELGQWEPDLIIIDSLTRVMEGDQNETAAAKAFTDAWVRIARRTGKGTSVGFLHHMAKLNGVRSAGPATSRVRGSGELVAAPRHIVMMARSGERLSLVTDGNIDRECDGFRLTYTRKIGAAGASMTLRRLEDEGADDALNVERKRKASEDKRRQRDAAVERDIMTIASANGVVSCAALASHRGSSKPNACRDYGANFEELVTNGWLAPTKRGEWKPTDLGREKTGPAASQLAA